MIFFFFFYVWRECIESELNIFLIWKEPRHHLAQCLFFIDEEVRNSKKQSNLLKSCGHCRTKGKNSSLSPSSQFKPLSPICDIWDTLVACLHVWDL